MDNIEKDLKLDEISLEAFTKEEVVDLFSDLSGIQNLEGYLKAVIYRDLLAYFNAPNENKDIIKGWIGRTRWLLAQIQKKEKTEKEPKGMAASPRHL